jgi:hypothetical protein
MPRFERYRLISTTTLPEELSTRIISVMKRYTTLATFFCVCLLVTLLQAGQKIYQSAKVFRIEPLNVSVPLDIRGAGTINAPATAGYEVAVLQDSTLYVGFCKRDECKLEWQVGDDVQYRLKGDRILLKRANGKELKLNFVLQGMVDAQVTFRVYRILNWR